MRISPIHETPNEPTPRQPFDDLKHLVRKVRHLFGTEEQTPQPQPVDERALRLGRFIADSFDLSKLSAIDLALSGAPSRPLRSDIQDYRYDDVKPLWALPEPIARLRFYGKDYDKQVGNDFLGVLGVFNLSDGTRLIQAAPSEYGAVDDFGVPDSNITLAGMRASLHELFSPNYDRTLEEYARFNVGVFHPDGEYETIRPINEGAFGAKHLPTILNVVGTAAVEGDLHIAVGGGQIRQYESGK